MTPLHFDIHEYDTSIESKILDLLEAVNNDFTPQLSQWVSLPDYAAKLAQRAVCWLVYEADELIGMAACYVNKTPEYSFWTMLAIRKEFRNRMAVLPLEQKVIAYCKAKGSAGIGAEVDPRHDELIQLHRMFGFEVGQVQVVNANRSIVPLTLTFKY